MRTFSIQTLGCKVNQYESEQIATLLRRRGLVQVDSPQADLRIVNTCSVTIQAASKSRQALRRLIRLPVLPITPSPSPLGEATPHSPSPGTLLHFPSPGTPGEGRGEGPGEGPSVQPKILATGCWATSNPDEARNLGIDAVLTHHHDVATELNRLLDIWTDELPEHSNKTSEALPKPLGDDGSIKEAGASARLSDLHDTSLARRPVKRNIGTRSLPLLDSRQNSHQRALLKIQDGCDAHCSYCIIPQLRPALWSKPIDDAVEEAERLVDAGHREIVLTGIFLGAYGQPTAIRRRQPRGTDKPLIELVSALCTQVPGLRRLRFSSLEPGDLTPELIRILKSHPQCVPHFHLPLQSGSDTILRRMNRQYTRDDFLRMIDTVREAFDRPAITTDIIAGFPGETDAEFEQTLEVVDRVRFIHIHAFSFSPRPRTAAARWTRDFVRGPVINQRIEVLQSRAAAHSLDFRRQFLGETVEVLVERQADPDSALRHGRCERYFSVYFESADARDGDLIDALIDRVTPQRTWGVGVHA